MGYKSFQKAIKLNSYPIEVPIFMVKLIFLYIVFCWKVKIEFFSFIFLGGLGELCWGLSSSTVWEFYYHDLVEFNVKLSYGSIKILMAGQIFVLQTIFEKSFVWISIVWNNSVFPDKFVI